MYYVIDTKRRVYANADSPASIQRALIRTKAAIRKGIIPRAPDPNTLRVVKWEGPFRTNVQNAVSDALEHGKV